MYRKLILSSLLVFLTSCGGGSESGGSDLVFDLDGDGVEDSLDAFPQDATESKDMDGDGIGDNSDPDVDGDGINNLDSNGNPLDLFPLDPTKTVDTDGDGLIDEEDTDDDGDGVEDSLDAFPKDFTETIDTDNDGIGNNADTDDDGDGISDQEEENTGLNPLLSDTDNDGINDGEDLFPLDSTEFSDVDQDGIGNNADTDDDNDGAPDIIDAFPLNPAEILDTDGDGIGNNADTDDDNDGVPDSVDLFPLDASETLDTDGDGIGNNSDSDDDGDDVPDILDAFPLIFAEATDADGDGIGNNADNDDDNDGVTDNLDAFPLNPAETIDTDGDGIGNNNDTDDDGDGVLDSADLFPLDPNKSAYEPPVADAGLDQTVTSGDLVTIDGSASRVGDTLIVSQQWTETGTSDITFTQIDSTAFRFTAPVVISATNFTLQLLVADENGLTSTDEMIVTVKPINSTPTIEMISPLAVVEIWQGETINFLSTTSGGNIPLSIEWDFGPLMTTLSVEDPGVIVMDSPGSYQVKVTVTDNDQEQDSDSILVTVKPTTTGRPSSPVDRVMVYAHPTPLVGSSIADEPATPMDKVMVYAHPTPTVGASIADDPSSASDQLLVFAAPSPSVQYPDENVDVVLGGPLDLGTISIITGQTINFSATINSNVLSYEWGYGAGTLQGASTSLLFQLEGIYPITLTVTYNDSSTEIYSISIRVVAEAQVLDLPAHPDSLYIMAPGSIQPSNIDSIPVNTP